MTRKDGNRIFWKIFSIEIMLIVFFASLCVVMHLRGNEDRINEKSAEVSDIMSDVYVEMPDGKQIPYSKIIIKLPESPKAVVEVKRPKKTSGKTRVCSSEIEQLVMQLAEEAEYKNVHLLKRIIKCESSWRPDAINWSSRDYGLWQINLRHNPEVTKECALDIDCATKWAIEQIQSGNIWKWNASRYCWGGSI
ncbi:transglycosylase SLT domain-containing protein [Candidatus Falkowbacteria bacterium]|nr:transglycosylase SLT domain-containing protein [Candidatus Falkowbacteria bacterium]